MCEKCQQLDSKIEHYRQISKLLTDEQTLKGLKLLFEKYQADRKALHSESP